MVDHIFDVREDCTKLEETEAMLFHNCVTKLLFVTKQARPYIQTSVTFLTTQVIDPDKDDYNELKIVLTYLNSTIYLPLTLQ